jgi:hypothetical protein
MPLRLWFALALVLSLAAPALAHASGGQVIRDCTDDGRLSHRYSQKDYADALAHLPTDVDEYSDCRSVIRRAQLGAFGGGGNGNGGGGNGASGGGGGAGSAGGGGGGGGTGDTGTGGGGPAPDPFATATPQERASFAKAVQSGAAPVRLDGRPVTPGTLGGSKVNRVSDLPTPLLVVLALLAAGALAAAGFGTRRFVIGRRTA